MVILRSLTAAATLERLSRVAATTRADQRGSILLTMLLVMCLTTLVMSSLTVSSIEWTLANNLERESQAFSFADSGVLHALSEIESSGDDIDALLLGADGTAGTADDGQIFGSAIAIGEGGYDAYVEDNHDDSDQSTDIDGTAFLVATGTHKNSQRRVRVTLSSSGGGSGWAPPYGVLTDGKLEIKDKVELRGPLGSAFANDEAEIDSEFIDVSAGSADELDLDNGVTIAGEELDRDEVDEYEESHSDLESVDLPEFDTGELRDLTDYRLSSDGKVYDSAGTLVHDTDDGDDDWGQWKFKDGDDSWELKNGVAGVDDGAFYVDGDVKVEGGDDLELTVISTGSVEFKGVMTLDAAIPGLVAATDGDVKVDVDGSFSGGLLVREQLTINGKITLNGNIAVLDEGSKHKLIKSRISATIEGDTIIIPTAGATFPIGGDGGGGTTITASEWHEERVGSVAWVAQGHGRGRGPGR